LVPRARPITVVPAAVADIVAVDVVILSSEPKMLQPELRVGVAV
jgi:hypothetical protein